MAKYKALRSFEIFMPAELVPLYDTLSSELGFILSTKKYRTKLEKLDITGLHRGEAIHKVEDIIRPRTKTRAWKNVHNKSWHARILAENIRREIESKRERILIYDLLKANYFKIDSNLKEALKAEKLYHSTGYLSNLAFSKAAPELAKQATFVLDYTQCDKNFFRVIREREFRIKVSKDTWIDYKVELPTGSSLIGATGKVAKPRFVKKDGVYKGLVSFEYQPEAPKGDRVLGIELGRVKPYSGAIVDKTGNLSPVEYSSSRRLERLFLKEKILKDQRMLVQRKLSNHKALGFESPKTLVLKEHSANLRYKIARLKEQQARLAAKEIAETALREGCSEIALENLSWLGSKGGKWNHSAVQCYIEEKAQERGLKVQKVNAAHTSKTDPVTGLRGTENGRFIILPDGSSIDRDFLAASNVAVRATKKTPKKLYRKPRVRKYKISAERKAELVKAIKGAALVVSVPGSVPTTGAVATGKETVVKSYSSLQCKQGP